MSTSTAQAIGLYQLCLNGAKTGLLGAPTFHVSLLVNPSANSITGVVQITQSVTPHGAATSINVTGTVHEMGFGGQNTKVIVLKGQYVVSVPPPAIGAYLQEFEAAIVFHGDGWANGLGNFHWGTSVDNSVPVKSVPCQ